MLAAPLKPSLELKNYVCLKSPSASKSVWSWTSRRRYARTTHTKSVAEAQCFVVAVLSGASFVLFKRPVGTAAAHSLQTLFNRSKMKSKDWIVQWLRSIV